MTFYSRCLLLAVSVLFALGLVMIFNTTAAEVLDLSLDRSPHHAFVRQLMYAVLAIAAMMGAYRLGYQKFLSLSPVLLFVFSFMLLLCLIPGIGKEVNGSKRWLFFAGISIQPSEFVKILLPAVMIHWSLQREKPWTLADFLKVVGIFFIPLLFILLEPNNGTVAVCGMVLALSFLLIRVPWKYWALPLLVGSILLGTIAIQLPYVRGRLQVYWNPELDVRGKGHQPLQAKIASGSGRLFGKGPGNSLQKLSYLPEAQNDYIAAIYAEEFGFVGIFFILATYMSIACLGFIIAYQCPWKQGAYLASCITFLIALQGFLNLGVVSGLLPSTGLNLPFFSQGGSSLLANGFGVGLLMNVGDKNG